MHLNVLITYFKPSPTSMALYMCPLMLICFPTEIITVILKTKTLKLSKLHTFFIFTPDRLLEKVSNLYLSSTKSGLFTTFRLLLFCPTFQNAYDRGNSQVAVSLGALRSPRLDSEQGRWNSHNVPHHPCWSQVTVGIQLMGWGGNLIILTWILMKSPTSITTKDLISIHQDGKLQPHPEALTCAHGHVWECEHVVYKERNDA